MKRKTVFLGVAFALLLATLIPLTAAHMEDDPFLADLIAGGGNAKSALDVGDVSIWNDVNFLYVKYETDAPWYITETHLHIALEWEDIPQKNGNPIPGHFTYNDEWVPPKTEHTYMIPLSWSTGTPLYIAAHAVVQRLMGYAPPSMEEFSEVLPDTVTLSVQYPYAGGPAYFPETLVTGEPLTGTYLGWCADTDHVIFQNTLYTANVYSSYESLPEGLIEYPENLDLVNFILNQNYVGQPSPYSSGIYTYGDVQRAIWALIEDSQSTAGLGAWSQTRVDEILADAQASGEGFEPGCDDSIAVILAPVNNEQVLLTQVTFIDVGLECTPIYHTETAWGAGLGFPGKNWATYITYTIQPYIITFPEEGNAYIGYEDRTGGDFDYNDFGMNMYVQETYTNGYLSEIHLEFTSVVHKAGDNHDIHITRILDGTTEYTYLITRDQPAYGTETPAGTGSHSGPFDIILFDSSDPNVVGKTVTIDINITTTTEMYNPAPTPPRWDLAPVFAYYDPWMHDKSYGPTDWHITDMQTTTQFGDPTPGINVPYIIIVPYTDWPAPDEGIIITTSYPDFDDYYRTQDPAYATWYIP